MKVGNTEYRTIWMAGTSVFMIDQNLLPFEFSVYEALSSDSSCEAIRTMRVRGAGAIGAAAGFAMAQAVYEAGGHDFMRRITAARTKIEQTRPTARDLFAATARVFDAARPYFNDTVLACQAAGKEAQSIADENVAAARAIGKYGNALLKEGYRVLTHCNAGWLAFVDQGSALSPVYEAKSEGKNIFVYADETRPRLQGARLTAWELHNAKIPFTIVPDNAGAHLMSKGLVDIIIVGADRIAANGDVANKIGTFEKAIVARAFGIPFYVAAPASTIDLDCRDGRHIIIEERSGDEVLYMTGPDEHGNIHHIRVAAPSATALNPAFDVTPANYITGIITDLGIFKPAELAAVFQDL